MVIDTGQIKAEMRREEKRKNEQIHESIRITVQIVQMLYLYFLTFKAGN